MPTNSALNLLTPPEAAETLRTNRRTLERWRTTGGGPSFVKIGRRVAYRAQDLADYVERQTRTHTAERTEGSS